MSIESQCGLSIDLAEESNNELFKTRSLYSKTYCKEYYLNPKNNQKIIFFRFSILAENVQKTFLKYKTHFSS